MNSLSSTGSTQANSWANNRREAIEKAQKLRDERKYGLANTGEMTLNTHNSKNKNATMNPQSATSKGFRAGATSTMNNPQENYGYKKAMTSTFDYSSKPVTYEEQQMAANSLKLLKSKMGRSNTQNMDQLDAFAEESAVNTKKASNPWSHEANLKKDSYRQPLDEVPQSGNQNYRKVFKPNFDNDDDNQGRSSGFNKAQPSRAQASKQGSQLDERQLRTIPSVDNDEDTGFTSHNIPSRIPKTTAAQSKFNKVPSYEDQPVGGSKLGAKRTRDEQPRYGDDSPVDDYLPASKQQYQPRQQEKVYNPSNYSAQNTVKPPSREMNNSRQKPAPQKGTSQMASQKPYSRDIDEDYEYERKHRQNQFEEEAEGEAGTEELIECPEGCGRKFFANVLAKHAKICVKVFQSKRKEFNMADHRITEDQAKVAVEKKKPASKLNQTKTNAAPTGNAKPLPKKAKWKQQSEMFRANLKQARGATLSKEEQMTVATSTDNLTQCDYCSRKFNEEAAKRHIPFCKNKTKMDSFKRAPTKGGKFGK